MEQKPWSSFLVLLLLGLVLGGYGTAAADPGLVLETRVVPGPRVEVFWEAAGHPEAEELVLVRRRRNALPGSETELWRGDNERGFFADPGGEPSLEYRYKLRAQNAAGETVAEVQSDWMRFHRENEVIPEIPPADPPVRVEDLGDTWVELAIGPSGGDEWVTRYEVRRFEGLQPVVGAFWVLETGMLDTGVPAEVAFRDQGLEPETEYGYQIRSFNAHQDFSSFFYSVTTQGGPEAPQVPDNQDAPPPEGDVPGAPDTEPEEPDPGDSAPGEPGLPAEEEETGAPRRRPRRPTPPRPRPPLELPPDLPADNTGVREETWRKAVEKCRILPAPGGLGPRFFLWGLEVWTWQWRHSGS